MPIGSVKLGIGFYTITTKCANFICKLLLYCLKKSAIKRILRPNIHHHLSSWTTFAHFLLKNIADTYHYFLHLKKFELYSYLTCHTPDFSMYIYIYMSRNIYFNIYYYDWDHLLCDFDIWIIPFCYASYTYLKRIRLLNNLKHIKFFRSMI